MTLDELNFKLLIDDSQFDAQANAIIAKAQKLNTTLSKMLTIMTLNRVITPEDLANVQKLNDLMAQTLSVEKKMNNARVKRVDLEKQLTEELQRQSQTAGKVPQTVTMNIDNSKTINNMRQAQEGFNKEVSKSSKLWMQLKNLTTAYFSVMGVSRLVSNLIRISAEFEKQRISLETILRDINGADRIFEQIKSLAVMSPFTFKELVTYTKQLSAFSVPMNELYDTTKMLADVSAGLGVGMDRLILAYGQIRSASFLRGQEVRQLTEAGVPILKELAKQLSELEGYSVSVGEVFDRISSRQVTFEMVEKVFKDMTSEGGKFYQMQEVLAQTLSGKISNLKDAYQIMFAEIGEKTNGVLVKSVDGLRELANNYEQVGKAILGLVAAYGVYRTVSAVMGARHWIELARTAGAAIPALTGLTAAIKNSNAAMALHSQIAKVNPYVALGAAAAGLVVLMVKLTKNTSQYAETMRIVDDAVHKFQTETANEEVKLKFLFRQLQNAKEGTEQYDTAKKKILNTYDQYLTDIDRENLALGKQEQVYRRLTAAIRETMASKAMEEGASEVGQRYEKSVGGILKQFDTYVNKYSKQHDVAESVWDQIGQYIRGEIDINAFTEEGKELYDAMMAGVEQAQKEAIARKKDNAWMIFGDVEVMRKNYAEAGQIADDALAEMEARLNRLYGPRYSTGGEENPLLKPWQQAILDIKEEAEKEGIHINLKVDDQSSLSEVVSTVKERIEETTKDIELYKGLQDDTAETLRKQLVYYEKINQQVLLGKATESGSGSGSGSNPRIKQIQAEIEAYKTLKAEYASLREYMDETAAKAALKSFYGGIFGDRVNDDFDEQIGALILDLAQLGEEGAKAAQSLSEGLANEALAKYIEGVKDAEEATREFEEMMAEMNDTFSLVGLSGVSLDIAKIVKGYKESLKKIYDERAKAVETLDRQALNSKMSDTEYENHLNKIFGFFDLQDANERTMAIDKVSDAIKKYYEEVRDEAIDFTNLSDKSIAQLKKMKDDISELAFKEIDPQVLESFEVMGLTINDVINVISRLVQGDLQKLDEETQKMTIRDWSKIARSGEELAQSIEELGKASGNVTLANIGSMLAEMSELAETILSAMDSGNWVGAFITVAISAANKVFKAMAKAAQAAAQAREEIRKIVTERYLDTMRDKIEATSTIFGDSFLANVKAVNSAINTLKKDVDKIFSTTGGRGEGSLYSFLQILSQASGIKLFDDDGLVNSDLLKVLQEAANGGDFFAASVMGRYKDQLLNLQDLSDELREMLSTLDETVGEIFSNLGESITDELIDKLWQTGEAVTDLEGTFQDLGNTIMKSLINSFVIDEILAKYKEQVKSWWTADMSADEIASQMEDFATNVRGDIEKANDIIVGIFNAFASRDLISNGEASENTLANGIKGITEETASLLASYVNAIRADVAAGRLQWEDMAANVRLMLGLLPQTPTLAEYLTQIQANTFNTAERTREIMERLELITTSEGGAAAFRVFM